MRIIVFFWLLIACFGMAVFSQVGDETLLQNLKCFSGNSSEFSDHWELYSLKGVRCGTGLLGNVIYRFGVKYWLYLCFENMFRFCLMILTMYTICLVTCLIFEPDESIYYYYGQELPSDDHVKENTSSSTSVSARMRRSEETVLKEIVKKKMLKRQHSYSAHSLHMRKLANIGDEGLEGIVRLCKSLPSINTDYFSKGSSLISDTLTTTSSLSLSTTQSSLPCSQLLTQSRSPIISMHSSSSSLDIALSYHSNHTIWTMYKYPVPPSITSSSPNQVQLRRAEKEFVFIQRPFVTPMPLVSNWLRENFFESQASHVNLGIQSSQIASCSNAVQLTNQANLRNQRDTAYLINNNKTEVIISGIPCSIDEIVPSKKWTSMFQLFDNHTDREKWGTSGVYTSLPNISEEFGVKHRMAFNVQDLEDLVLQKAINPEENNQISFDDNLDSISVVRHKTESDGIGIDQDKRDESIEANSTQRQRRPMVFKKQDCKELEPTAKFIRPNFVKELKQQTYKQIVVPLLLHAGKEVLLNFLFTIVQ